jgi:uncharacterized membrane protein YccC
MARHASVRSVWFLNSLRGSLALAAAVLVADQTGVQHGLWVMFGTLSVLRTDAASTGSTALRALGGTVIGFAAGALLLLGLGTSTPVLWTALTIAIAVAAYAPGTLPFAVGQGAFTVAVVVLFNVLQPVGWRLGLLRVQDVAMGCAVSLVAGVLFWPRGASSVVGDDLAEAFRRGAAYLTQAVDWALSGGRRGHRWDTAGRGAPRLPRRAGREAGVKGGPVDASGGHHAAQAHLHLAGQPAGAGAGPAPPSEHGPCARRA